MSLDSTDFRTNAMDGKHDDEANVRFGSERMVLPTSKQASSWTYLFVHRTKITVVEERLQARFRTFIHKSIFHKRTDKGIRKDERPTISGLLFVQGNVVEIQNFLRENFSDMHLAKDCTTDKPAEISDSVMQPFMQMSKIEPARIRFLPHEYGYYSTGNVPVCITSGILEGFVGYRIRLNRDRCFILSIGGMAVAINGIHRDSFENLEEYARRRKLLLQSAAGTGVEARRSRLEELSSCIFTPENQLDVMAIAKILSIWLTKAEELAKDGKPGEAADMALAVIEEAGHSLKKVFSERNIYNLYEVDDVCHALGRLLASIMANGSIPLQTRLQVLSWSRSLHRLFPFLQLGDIPGSLKG